jgi:hypothetical protein
LKRYRSIPIWLANNRLQRPALRAAAESERYVHLVDHGGLCYSRHQIGEHENR